jgi:hypothetical protein
MEDRGFESKWGLIYFFQTFCNLKKISSIYIYTIFLKKWLSLLLCLWNSKRCCGPPFTTPISMKINANGQEMNNISVHVS